MPEKSSILIVEDDRDIRDSMVEVLQLEGYKIATAAHGQQGLEQLRTGARPSLILLDLMMPIMDGFKFREAQLADRRFAEIPVIVMSADAHIEQKSARIGGCGFLKKPLDIEMTLSMIAKCLA